MSDRGRTSYVALSSVATNVCRLLCLPVRATCGPMCACWCSMATCWCPEPAGPIDHNTDDEHHRCAKNNNPCDPIQPAVIADGCRIATWKWQCPQHHEGKKRRNDIQEFYIRNSLDQRLAELGSGQKTVGVNHAMRQPFQKNASASHHDEPDRGADEHFFSKRIRATAQAFCRAAIKQIVDGHDGDGAGGKRLWDETRQSQGGVESPQADGREDERSATAKRSDQARYEATRQGFWIGMRQSC